ncbi:MAG: cytochrome c oxidase subunit II [Alcanivorax sp.]|nr:cytochrome c oxidase subunit II [Alcanivorax sp.]
MARASDWADRSNLDLRPGVTQSSHEVHDLHTDILWIVTAIGLLVFGLILTAMIRHRRSRRPNPSTFHENVYLEVTWTVVPFLILVAMAWPATRVLFQLEDTSGAQLTVKVTGSRWKWNYEYLTYKNDKQVGVSFYSNIATPIEQRETPVFAAGLFPYGTASDRGGKPAPKKDHNYNLEVDHPLVIPSGIKVRFLITSDDVIHSFWVPDFGGKKDAIPGYVNETWTKVPKGKEGTYYGQCTELCGKGHAFMPIEVKVVGEDRFDSWLADQKAKAAAAPDLTPYPDLKTAIAAGEKVYKANCALCHGANGEGGIGLKFAGSEFMTNSKHLGEHIDTVINGRNAMPSFKAQLSPRDIAAVISYERNAFGNNSGDFVQPADVDKHENK